MMVQALSKAFEAVSFLPEDQQELIASLIMNELDSEAKWDRLSANLNPGSVIWQRPLGGLSKPVRPSQSPRRERDVPRYQGIPRTAWTTAC
jgi:hypothetical protein